MADFRGLPVCPDTGRTCGRIGPKIIRGTIELVVQERISTFLPKPLQVLTAGVLIIFIMLLSRYMWMQPREAPAGKSSETALERA